METLKALKVIDPLTESQWGLFTASQAISQGVSKLDLSRLAKNGQIERLAHGVYKNAGVPTDSLEDLRVAWLSTAPSVRAEQRINNPSRDFVVSGASATWLHDIGDLLPEPFTFSAPKRKQSQRREIKYWIRELDAESVTIVDGLPAVTATQAIADLVAKRTDLSLVADVYADAFRAGKINSDHLERLLSPLAARNGFKKNNGAALLNQIETLAQLDDESLADQVAHTSIASLIVQRLQDPAFLEMMDKIRETNQLNNSAAHDVIQASLVHSQLTFSEQLAKMISKSLFPEGFNKNIAEQIMKGAQLVLESDTTTNGVSSEVSDTTND
ncbi:MAG: type IV toxin-antitoxin system AbiEi family antitoxin domain-containing protein [Candidatus Nanopelagicales bacterium]